MRLPDLSPRRWAVVGLLVVVVVALVVAPFVVGGGSDDDAGPGGAAASSPSVAPAAATPSPVPTPVASVPAARSPGVVGVDPGPGPASSADSPDVATAYCSGLMPVQAVTDLTGHAMGPGTVVPVKGSMGCSWAASDGSQTTVQALNASSSTWGAGLPGLVSSLTAQGVVLSDATQADLATAQSQVDAGMEVDADLACEVFSLLAQDGGRPADVQALVAVVPDLVQPRSILVEACAADEYSFLQVSSPDLAPDLAEETQRTEQALQVIHGAPLRF